VQALVRGVQFYRNARLLPTAAQATELQALACDGSGDTSAGCGLFSTLKPPFNASSGDGQLGVFEGLTSDIAMDGNQPMSLGVRCDCVTESSTSFAVRAVVTGNVSDRLVAINLLNFGHIHAGYSQPWVVGAGPALTADRPWAPVGDAFGIKSWTTNDAAYRLFYKDDDARGLLVGRLLAKHFVLFPRGLAVCC
jgi:hypothetical protein